MQSFILPILSLVLGIAIAKPVIAFLKQLKGYQAFREQGPQSHIEEKAGTPTMGAWIFLIPIFILGGYLAWQMQSQSLSLVLLAFFVGAFLGAVDDGLKILESNYKGLDSKQKLIVQFILSSFIVFASERYLFVGNEFIPEKFNFILVIFEFVWAFCVIAGTSNAINISDGLDGLATTLTILAFVGFAGIFHLENFFFLFDLSLIIIAALIAFLIFNKKPAQVFMGDTGSLALGLGLGTLAYIAKLELYLLVFAVVPVIETLSVIIQVLSAKLSRKFLGKDIRIFKMAPLHHHFELSGFAETTVVIIFAIFQFIFLVLGLLFYLGYIHY
jgi:phospho-N-acetylmuramoyl-pentapeptide-transferase